LWISATLEEPMQEAPTFARQQTEDDADEAGAPIGKIHLFIIQESEAGNRFW
jgi:ATP-dependent helicase YprA (DUF1998 family)